MIRAARADEATVLTELAVRSKGHWGYDARFLDDCRDELTISPEYVETNPVYVLEAEGRVVGFYSLKGEGSAVALDFLYVEPSEVGRGHGRRLFRHAADTARRLGFSLMTIEADPHAEAFYEAQGARRVGEIASPVRAGRALPLLHFTLAESRTPNID